MISIEMGELYGMTSPEELIEAIDFLKNMGMSDAQVQAVLDIAKSSKSNWIDNSVLFKRVNELPPVTPQ